MRPPSLSLLLAPLLLAVACADKARESGTVDSSGGGVGADGGGDDGTVQPPAAEVALTGSGVTVSITGGPGAYWFGIAQTGPGGWTGEDCVYGYTTGTGEEYRFCHDAGETGGSYAKVAGFADMTEGTTLFDASFDSASLTYYLESDPAFGGDGSCYVWGAEPDYYSALGCAAL